MTDQKTSAPVKAVPKYQQPPEVTVVKVGPARAFWTVPTKPIYVLCCWGVQCDACGWRLSGYVKQDMAVWFAERHVEGANCAA